MPGRPADGRRVGPARVPVRLGPVDLDPTDPEATTRPSFPPPAGTTPAQTGPTVLAAFIPGAGLGVATAASDRAALLAGSNTVAGWLAVTGPRTVLLAAPRSFCAGVERAIEIVERALLQRSAPVYIRKQIVHHTQVVSELRALGAQFVSDLDEVPFGATVVFPAHGVAPAVRAQAQLRGLDVIDATCPLVARAHETARQAAGRGDTVVFIGQSDHEETDGMLGAAAPDAVLVQDAADVDRLTVADPARLVYLTQTTLAADETAEVVDRLRARFPAARGPAPQDECHAATNRQNALLAIAAEADLVLVIGLAHAADSARLVELARRQGTAAYPIETAADICPQWLAQARVIGLTAGASAPPYLVDDVVAALRGLGTLTVIERETARETVRDTIQYAPPVPAE